MLIKRMKMFFFSKPELVDLREDSFKKKKKAMEGAWCGNYRRSAAAHQPVAVQLSRARYGNRNRLTDDILGLVQSRWYQRASLLAVCISEPSP